MRHPSTSRSTFEAEAHFDDEEEERRISIGDASFLEQRQKEFPRHSPKCTFRRRQSDDSGCQEVVFTRAGTNDVCPADQRARVCVCVRTRFPRRPPPARPPSGSRARGHFSPDQFQTSPQPEDIIRTKPSIRTTPEDPGSRSKFITHLLKKECPRLYALDSLPGRQCLGLLSSTRSPHTSSSPWSLSASTSEMRRAKEATFFSLFF